MKKKDMPKKMPIYLSPPFNFISALNHLPTIGTNNKHRSTYVTKLLAFCETSLPNVNRPGQSLRYYQFSVHLNQKLFKNVIKN